MKNTILFALLLSLGVTTTNAQRNCATHEHMLQQMEQFPEMEKNMKDIEKFTSTFLENNDARINGTIVTIPVVFHIVYKTGAQNISEAQIQTQLDVLNDDFRRMNADADGTWNQASDTEIEFCLATVDPNGNPTNGIQRRSTNKPSFSSNNNVKFNNKGGLNAWPAGDYLNFWVCNLGSGLLGYAQFPGGPANTDGVVCDYQYVGTIGTATAPYDLGRTATHEVGHWLNLRHIWGDGGCSVDDFVSDTPLSDASNGGCAVGHVSCGSVDMVQNYMDYSYDACMNLFTAGQSSRMNALFASGGARAILLSSGGCGGAAPETCTDGIQNNGETGVDCGGPNCDPCSTTETCSDGILNNGETDVDCGGPNCSPCTTPETCDDGILNNGETDIDCGGPNCSPCSTGGSCDTPTGTYASNIKPKKARTNWTAVSSATNYNIQIDEAGQTNWNNFSTTGTNRTISGLSNGQSYDWRVQAVCGSDVSEWSAICNFTAGSSNSGDCAARLMDLTELIKIYPNPAVETIRIGNIDASLITTIEIIQLDGKVIYVKTGDQAVAGIEVSDLQAGMYMLRVNYIDNTSALKRFVVIN